MKITIENQDKAQDKSHNETRYDRNYESRNGPKPIEKKFQKLPEADISTSSYKTMIEVTLSHVRLKFRKGANERSSKLRE